MLMAGRSDGRCSAFRDFHPRPWGFFPGRKTIEAEYVATLDRANAWMVAESIDVMHVETMRAVEGSSEPQYFRIWYRSLDKQPAPSPAIDRKPEPHPEI